MARRGKDNDHTKSGKLDRRGQYRIQHEMMMMMFIASKIKEKLLEIGFSEEIRTT